MSTTTLRFALPLAVAALAATASGALAASAKPVSCEIRLASSGVTRELTAVATSSTPIASSYQFDVTAVSAGGKAVTSQGNDMTLAAGQTVLGTANIGAASHFTATLTLSWASGSTICNQKG
jgi:hypothetical protein